MHQGSFLLLPLTDITAKGCVNFSQLKAKEEKVSQEANLQGRRRSNSLGS